VPTKPFADLPPTPVEHFKLYFYAAVLQVIVQAAQAFGSYEALFGHYPFLLGYDEELGRQGVDHALGDAASVWWRDAVLAWEQSVPGHLPLRALRQAAGLDHAALTLLMNIGLIEEDARFGWLFETIQGTPGQHRPTIGLLNASWGARSDLGQTRAHLRHLQALGLAQVVNPDAPRIEWALQIPGVLWDVLGGEPREALAPWAQYRAPERLVAQEALLVPEALRQRLTAIPTLLASRESQAVIIRGPQHNGRRTVMGCMARAQGRGSLTINGLSRADDERWRLVGPLATLLHAMPVVVFDLAPGETADLPQLTGYDGPLGVVLGKQGGVRGAGIERAITLGLEMPDVTLRRQHWAASVLGYAIDDLQAICEGYRLSGGNIRRAAALATTYAGVEDRTVITATDVQEATRALNRQMLDTLAERVPTSGDWSHFAVNSQTLAELFNLESRCRHRERLPVAVGAALGAQLNAGVRALFSGPSGTGKTLAARLLAAALHMDLYRVDLSTVVNKYIGETEKNLNQVFARAEELGIILLLDEGDALLTQRTGVQTSNDRYANLETNYLLQRLETYEGIIIVTTNAGERIDSAFQRRIDVVINFRPPEAAERWSIWQLHLPPSHAIDDALLREVVGRCSLTGGQIRNAVLQASLLALDDGQIITSAHLEAAVQREYRKVGAVCPLRSTPTLTNHRRW
jgi:ATP-dependent 26S proteasome regulatory subunit